MLKSVLFVAIGLLSALPAFADKCTGVLYVVASDDRSQVARAQSAQRCYNLAYGSGSSYCLEPRYIGKVGHNNDAWATGLVITRRDGSTRRACNQVAETCYNLRQGRDWCEVQRPF